MITVTACTLLKTFYPRHFEHLRHLIASDTMQHSYCLAGPAEGAQEMFAQAWAAAMVCEQKTIAPCFACNACQQVQRGIHPDVHMIPETGKQTELSIADAREIQHMMYQRPVQSPWTIVVLSTGEQLRTAVGNALLKIVEEPPPRAVLLCTTAQMQQLPATLRSRMMPWYMPPVGYHAATDYVANTFAHDSTKRECINLADGRFERLYTLWYPEQQIKTKERTETWWREHSRFWLSFLNASLAQREKLLTDRFTTIYGNKKTPLSQEQQKHDILAVFDILLMLFRDALLMRHQSPSLTHFPFLSNELRETPTIFSALTKKIQLCASLRQHIAHNGNKKMILDYLCVTL